MPLSSAWLPRGLAVLAVSLLALHLLFANRISFEDLRFAMMGAVALVAIVWNAVDRVEAKIDSPSILMGTLLLGFTLWRLQEPAGALAAGLAPVPLGLGLALLIGGWRRLHEFWREGIIVAGLTVSPFVESVALELLGLDLSPGTAQFTAGLLRVGGWNASAHDVIVGLPDAWIVVSQGCSGLKTMYFLVGFSVVLLLLYPLPGTGRKLVVIGSAAIIGYVVNAVRVAILALLAAPGHEGAFHFWHIKQGAMVFEIIAMTVFLALVYLIMPTRRTGPKEKAVPQ